MLSVKICCILILCTVVYASPPPSLLPPTVYPPAPFITNQMHSWNDLDEWKQMLHKITDRESVPVVNTMKIDLFFVLNGDGGDFVLVHDVPQAGGPYNTTKDLAALIKDREYSRFFSNSSIKTILALCFKTHNVDFCKSDKTSKTWTTTVIRVVNELLDIINLNKLNIQIVLDGSFTLHNKPCLVNVLPQLPITWTLRPSKTDSDPMEAATSDDVSKGYNRYRIMNIGMDFPTETNFLKKLQSIGYGKFAVKNGTTPQYPLVLWEPSDQKTIHEICQIYTLYDYWHPAPYGFRLAINMDPVQLDVFTAEYSRRSMNFRVPGVPPVEPVLRWLARDRLSSDMMIIYSHLRHVYYNVVHITSDQPLTVSPTVGPQARISNLTTLSAVTSSYLYKNHSYLVIASETAELYVLDDMQVIHVFKCKQTPMSIDMTCIDMQCVLVYVHGDGGIGTADLNLSTMTLSDRGLTRSASDQLQSASVTMTTMTSSRRITALIVTVDANDEVIGEIVEFFNFNISSLSRGTIGRGHHVEASLSPDGRFSIVVGDGCCYNNNDNNKAATFRLCASKCTASNGTLVYVVGSLSELMTSWRAEPDVAPVCWRSGVLYGNYDNGFYPSLLNFEYDHGHYIIDVHLGSAPSQLCECGRSLPYNGVVMDMFRI